VVETLELEDITGDQRYDIIFNSTKEGKRKCAKTAKRLNNLPKQLKDQNITSTLHTKSCNKFEKVLSCTLNNAGLKWVSSTGNM